MAGPLRQIQRSSHMVRKQRAVLEAYKGMTADEIPKPYQMKTRDYERHLRILKKHEALLAESIKAFMGFKS